MTGRIRWTTAPGSAADVEQIAEAFGGAEVVKNGPHRAVYRLPGLGVYWKHCKLSTLRSWLREVVRPPKARMEFDKAVALRSRGVPTFEPLAWGVRHGVMPGESFLLTRALDDAVPLSELLGRPMTPAERRAVAERLGRFLALLHNAGVTHPDMHPGNILVRAFTPLSPCGRGVGGEGSLPLSGDPSGPCPPTPLPQGERGEREDSLPPGGRGEVLGFYLLDLHAIRLSSPLAASASRDNLTTLNRWFRLRATRSDRLRFWRAYAAERTVKLDPRELERLTDDSNHHFWRSREWRYTSTNRYYRRVRSPAASGFAVRDFDAAALLADPDLPFRDGRILKDSRTSTVALWSVGGRTFVYKRFNLRKRFGAWLNLVRPSSAMRSWCGGQSLCDRQLPTPRPLVVLHRRRFGMPAEGYLLTEYLPDARDLHQMLDAGTRPGELAQSMGRLVRTLHERRLSHRDLKASNVLIDANGAASLIDLVGVTDHKRLPRSRRVQNLARLNASFLNRPEVSRGDRLRFLRAYLNWGTLGKSGWKEWWREVDAATQAKAAKNLRSGRVLT